MASVFARYHQLYATIKGPNGLWHQTRTGFTVGQESAALRWAEHEEREALAGAVLSGPLTLRAYARSWLARRRNQSAGDDRARLEHVLPKYGEVLLAEFRPHHARVLITGLKNDGMLAPRTIRQVSGILHTLFQSAFIEELIPANPVKYERGVLPNKVDKDPTWRPQAIYARAEGEQLLSDERLPPDRRVLYGLKFLALLRHSEAARLRWSEWDTAARPLGSLNVIHAKSGFPRLVPAHPVLARMLAAWKLSGWPIVYGRHAEPGDLIVPTRRFRPRAAAAAQVQLLEDLARLELRVEAGQTRKRRGHDLRRTGITLLRTDGALDSMLRWISHGPRANEIIDLYSTPPWEALCAEMIKLRVELREGKLLSLAR